MKSNLLIEKLITDPRVISPRIILEARTSNKQISLVLNNFFLNSNLNLKQRQTTTDFVNGTIRMSRRLIFEIKNALKGDINSLDDLFIETMKVAIYQIICKNTPNYAVVNETVNIVKIYFNKYTSLSNALLRKVIKNKANDIKLDSDYDIAIYYSHPTWLIKRWVDIMDTSKLIDILNYNNSRPTIWFRIRDVNYFKEIEKYLLDMKIKMITHHNFSEFICIDRPSILLNSIFFSSGYITVQNPINSLIVNLLTLKGNESIIDACASPGGKTANIADRLSDNGYIYAYDMMRESKFRDTMKRLNISNYSFSIEDASQCKLPMVDKSICDVPCSGTGTLSKRSDLRWRLKQSNIKEHQINQIKILNNVSKSIAASGILIYSTCSIEQEENWDVVDAFLLKNPNFIIEDASKFINEKYVDSRGAMNILPYEHNMDGGFAVRMVNNDK